MTTVFCLGGPLDGQEVAVPPDVGGPDGFLWQTCEMEPIPVSQDWSQQHVTVKTTFYKFGIYEPPMRLSQRSSVRPPWEREIKNEWFLAIADPFECPRLAKQIKNFRCPNAFDHEEGRPYIEEHSAFQ